MSRILIVDHQHDASRELAEALRAAGYDVQCATNGVDAINRFNGVGADAVVLNILMPHGDGLRTLKWIRACADHDEVPVIVHGELTDAEWSQASAAGADERWDHGDFREILNLLKPLINNVPVYAAA